MQEKSLEEKAAIVLEMLKGKASVEEICQRHQVSITDAYNWCVLFLDGAKKHLKKVMMKRRLYKETKKIGKVIE